MEPAAVLVASLRGRGRRESRCRAVRAGAGASAVRAAHHGLVRRARIEPDVERVLDLVVLVEVVGAESPRTSSVCHASMPPFSTRCATSSSSASVRGCSAPVSLCTKNGIGTPHWRCARQRPVGPVRDHAVEPRLAPGREELGRLDAARAPSRAASRSGFAAVPAGHVVHAGEPLRRRAIDDRRLVPPAVHVAVRELLGVTAARPTSRSLATICGFASQIFRPPKNGRLPAKRPSPCTGLRISSSVMP